MGGIRNSKFETNKTSGDPSTRPTDSDRISSDAPVAQWIEHRTSDPVVRGSSPLRRARDTSHLPAPRGLVYVVPLPPNLTTRLTSTSRQSYANPLPTNLLGYACKLLLDARSNHARRAIYFLGPSRENKCHGVAAEKRSRAAPIRIARPRTPPGQARDTSILRRKRALLTSPPTQPPSRRVLPPPADSPTPICGTYAVPGPRILGS